MSFTVTVLVVLTGSIVTEAEHLAVIAYFAQTNTGESCSIE